MFGRKRNTTHQTTKQIGDLAEQQAEQFLLARGMKTITKNFNCKGGEVDLIMRHGNTVVFVEVRYRKNQAFGAGADTVDFRKQGKVVTAAQSYLQKHKLTDTQPCRFDVISISGNIEQPDINWIENAFGA